MGSSEIRSLAGSNDRAAGAGRRGTYAGAGAVPPDCRDADSAPVAFRAAVRGTCSMSGASSPSLRGDFRGSRGRISRVRGRFSRPRGRFRRNRGRPPDYAQVAPRGSATALGNRRMAPGSANAAPPVAQAAPSLGKRPRATGEWPLARSMPPRRPNRQPAPGRKCPCHCGNHPPQPGNRAASVGKRLSRSVRRTCRAANPFPPSLASPAGPAVNATRSGKGFPSHRQGERDRARTVGEPTSPRPVVVSSVPALRTRSVPPRPGRRFAWTPPARCPRHGR